MSYSAGSELLLTPPGVMPACSLILRGFIFLTGMLGELGVPVAGVGVDDADIWALDGFRSTGLISFLSEFFRVSLL